jgi:hypothetical protein
MTKEDRKKKTRDERKYGNWKTAKWISREVQLHTRCNSMPRQRKRLSREKTNDQE